MGGLSRNTDSHRDVSVLEELMNKEVSTSNAIMDQIIQRRKGENC